MMGTNDIPIGMNIIELTTYVELLHNLIKYDQLLIFFMINFCFEITSNGLVTHFIVCCAWKISTPLYTFLAQWIEGYFILLLHPSLSKLFSTGSFLKESFMSNLLPWKQIFHIAGDLGQSSLLWHVMFCKIKTPGQPTKIVLIVHHRSSFVNPIKEPLFKALVLLK